MPRARIEITGRFVGNLIHFDIEFDDLIPGVTMIYKNIVPDSMSSRPPNDRLVSPSQQFTCTLHVRPILQLERNVMHPSMFTIQKIQRVVVRPAT